MEDNLPVISLELNSGQFRIKTSEAVYQITVSPDSTLTRVVEKVVERETTAAPAPPSDVQATAPAFDENDIFYRELTEELYSEIGKLARQLSLSIKEIPPAGFTGVDIEQTGIELEDAKGQLEDIVQMTEKATMDIMDLAESIQDDLVSVRESLSDIRSLDFLGQESPDLDWDDGVPEEGEAEAEDIDAPAPEAAGLDLSPLDQLIAKAGALRQAVAELPVFSAVPAEAPAPAPAPEPAPAETQTVIRKQYKVDPDVIFQTLYEFCTNETVKDHIKLMRAEQDAAFDLPAAMQALSDTAGTVEVDEDNFYLFPISGLLKSFYQFAKKDKHKQVLKKMNQTVGNIFLEPHLPLELVVEEVEEAVAAPSAPATAAAPAAPSSAPQPGLPQERIDELTAALDQHLNELELEKGRLVDEFGSRPAAGVGEGEPGDDSWVKPEERQRMIELLDASSEQVHGILARITRILEALSFQDLSGQRILKIVRLISEVQVQLLSLLVAYGARLKLKKEKAEGAASLDETTKLAQTEVDKMLEKVSGPSALEGPEAEGRLDQDAVNTLLADLGF